jgi:hypothetical protein
MDMSPVPEWSRVGDIATATGMKPNTIRRRISRLDQADQDRFTRRVVDSVDGGKPRLEVHRDLVERWKPAPPAVSAIGNDSSLAVADLLNYSHVLAEAETLRQRNADLEARLTEKDFALAEARDRIRALGQLVQALTK